MRSIGSEDNDKTTSTNSTGTKISSSYISNTSTESISSLECIAASTQADQDVSQITPDLATENALFSNIDDALYRKHEAVILPKLTQATTSAALKKYTDDEKWHSISSRFSELEQQEEQKRSCSKSKHGQISLD